MTDPLPADADDERQLAERAAEGDVAAVEQLVARHLPALRAYARLRQGPALSARESSSDVVQSVCRELFAGLDGFRWQGPAAFRGWLYTATRRKLADRAEHLGAAKRDVAREDPGGDAALAAAYARLATPSQQVLGQEFLARVEAAFAALPENWREAVVLSRLVGLSHAEIATRLERSEGSVRNLVSRGLARLAEALADD